MRFLTMGRLFLVLVLLAVSLYVVKLIKIKLDEPTPKLKKGSSRKENVDNSKMVKCLHCGLHIPDNEAIKQGDKVFCSLEHAGKEI
jgi:uncharacterized protein